VFTGGGGSGAQSIPVGFAWWWFGPRAAACIA